MWALVNQTPFAAARAFARDREGSELWLIVVKGTFTVAADGSTEIAQKQEPVRFTPVYQGKPGESSLLYDADIVPSKPTTDVYLHGHAYAPGNQPASEVSVTLSVGPLRKTLRVVGDRVWKEGTLAPKLSEPVPFVTMPLVYERAFGGQDAQQRRRDQRNPLGKGFFVKLADLHAREAPNIEYPGTPDAALPAKRRPAGFGPIARDWSPRLDLAGTYDDAWAQSRKPLVPADFDDRFYQAAPEDQQTPRYLIGGEPVELTNLTRSGVWRFRLPRVALGYATAFSRRQEWQRPDLHTVVIEPDLGRVVLVWHAALPCHYTLHDLKRTLVFLKRRLTSLQPDDPRLLLADNRVSWIAK